MAQRYPIEQFRDLNLPGFEAETSVNEIAAQPTDWQSVLSLSIFSRSPEDRSHIEVLTGIRADDTETHPHVVSTPTGRFPHAFQLPLLSSRTQHLLEATTFKFDEVSVANYQMVARFAPNMSTIPDREDVLSFLVLEQMARKLGMAESLQKTKDSRPLGTISLTGVLAGFSYAANADDGTPLWEPLLMYGGAVMLDDRSVIPEETKAYKKISWTSIDDFLAGQSGRKAELLIPEIGSDAATVCVRGLCLTTTSKVSQVDNLRAHLGLDS